MCRYFLVCLLMMASVCGQSVVASAIPRSHPTYVADGFDAPLGKPRGEGYRIQRGFRSGSHMGEDWNGNGGGNTDRGDPVYTVAHGLVVMARNAGGGWGNLVIVRHVFYERGKFHFVDSAYAHLDRITVREGQQVAKGRQIGTLGNTGRSSAAHLHFEIRKNLNIGYNQRGFKGTYENYHNPLDFLRTHRRLSRPVLSAQVPIGTFPMPKKP